MTLGWHFSNRKEKDHKGKSPPKTSTSSVSHPHEEAEQTQGPDANIISSDKAELISYRAAAERSKPAMDCQNWLNGPESKPAWAHCGAEWKPPPSFRKTYIPRHYGMDPVEPPPIRSPRDQTKGTKTLQDIATHEAAPFEEPSLIPPHTKNFNECPDPHTNSEETDCQAFGNSPSEFTNLELVSTEFTMESSDRRYTMRPKSAKKVLWLNIENIPEIEQLETLDFKNNDIVRWLDYDSKYLESSPDCLPVDELLECETWSGKSVVVPSEYAHLISSKLELARELQRRPRAEVVEDFDGTSNEELSVRVGEVIYLLFACNSAEFMALNKCFLRGRVPRRVLNILVAP
ncbi:hypothetical protein TcWFU_004280 [Taenia crassiceps]|uniref:SH3 domain-containing protein n=1 Tax=Taenia crassiceps TaxID=6207 RepID=A0ABR4Q292_9CEST